ncbi:MAG: hypothetical protein R3A48_22630 [Polyangiales bacterium]
MLRPLLALALCLGCASAVSPTGGDLDGGGAPNDRLGPRDVVDARIDIPYFDAPSYDIFREDACPGPRPAPMRAYECDTFAQTGCPAGEGCYAFIEYPSERCGSETYRARCFAAGSTAAGRFCQSGSECAPGSGCFVTGAMNRCLRLCRLDGAGEPCPRGSVCEPTDLPDFGACQ